MTDRQRFLVSGLVLLVVAVVTAGTAILILYNAAYEQEGHRLVDTVRSQARMIEAIARFDLRHGIVVRDDHFGGLLERIQDTYERYRGHGSAEFTMAHREGDSIVFLVSSAHREGSGEVPSPVPFHSDMAEPMRLALLGGSGTVTGLDYRGKPVLAAYEPLGAMAVGLVAKVDLDEIRAPFVRAAWIVAFVTVLVLGVAGLVYRSVSGTLLLHIEEGEARYRTLFESASYGVFVAGETIEDCNEEAARLFACEREDLIGAEGTRLLPPEQPDGSESEVVLREHIKTALEGRPQLFCLRSIRKDGVEIDTEQSLKAVEVDGRRKLVATVRDITAQVQAEEQLRRLSRAIEQSPASVVITDLEGNIEYVNPKVVEMTGYRPDELIGRNPRIFKSGKTRPEVYERLWATITAGRTWRGELYNKRKNGELYWESASISPVTNAQGRVTHYVGVKEDTTARRQAEETIRQINVTLERRVEERTAALESAVIDLESFAYAVSHDLRQPLRSVHGFVQILEEDLGAALGAEETSHFLRIRDAIGRMSEMLDALLRLSRVGREGIRESEVDLSAMATSIAAELRETTSDREVELEIQEGLEVVADRGLVAQLLRNLIGNAWKFTRDRSPARIEFGAEGTEKGWVYFVRDNGVGFHMSQVNRIFAPFQRLHQPSEFEGTGIGLATARRIVALHGGRIWADGHVERGATFRFTLDGGHASTDWTRDGEWETDRLDA